MKPAEILEADVVWCEERAQALMREGASYGEAYDAAVRERTSVILARQADAMDASLLALQEYRDRQMDERRQKRQAEEEKRRADIRARQTLAQRPTLTASLGDLVLAKWRKRA